MAKPIIVTRAGKGSELTFTEGDANFTNLQNATITVTDGTNSKALDLNSTLTFTAGTNVTLSVDSGTGAVTINSTASGGGSGTVTSVSGTGTVNGLTLTGTVTTTGSLTLGGILNLSSPPAIGGTTANTGRFTTITSTVITGAAPFIVASTTEVANLRAAYASKVTNAIDTTSTSTYLIFTANADTNNSVLGINGSLTFDASTQLLTTKSLAFKDTREPVYALGTTGGTIAPNCANGSVQSITLNAALTINAFTSPIAGQSLTLIITGGTAYTSITSTMKFAGGIKTLTATAGCIDILTVYYTGAVYYASLGKGFA